MRFLSQFSQACLKFNNLISKWKVLLKISWVLSTTLLLKLMASSQRAFSRDMKTGLFLENEAKLTEDLLQRSKFRNLNNSGPHLSSACQLTAQPSSKPIIIRYLHLFRYQFMLRSPGLSNQRSCLRIMTTWGLKKTKQWKTLRSVKIVTLPISNDFCPIDIITVKDNISWQLINSNLWAEDFWENLKVREHQANFMEKGLFLEEPWTMVTAKNPCKGPTSIVDSFSLEYSPINSTEKLKWEEKDKDNNRKKFHLSSQKLLTIRTWRQEVVRKTMNFQSLVVRNLSTAITSSNTLTRLTRGNSGRK